MKTKLSWSKIHKALHGTDDTVIVNEKEYQIKLHTNGCRYVTYSDMLMGKVMIMQQNKHKTSQFAERARNGETLSWVIPDDKSLTWHLIEIPVRKTATH